MNAYYPNTLKIVKDFKRTEEALRCRAWALDSHANAFYGYSRVPMSFIKDPRGLLEKTSYDYKYEDMPKDKDKHPTGTLTAMSGQQWELHFEDSVEQYKWKSYYLGVMMSLPRSIS